MVTYDHNLYLFKISPVFHELKLWYFFAHFFNKIDVAKALTMCTG